MHNNAEHKPSKNIANISLHWLQKLLRLWSLQTLTSLPERLRNLWQQLLGSYWFIPTACVLLGLLLAPLLVLMDQQFDRATVKEISFAFTGDNAYVVIPLQNHNLQQTLALHIAIDHNYDDNI